jgi:hypothetical protein
MCLLESSATRDGGFMATLATEVPLPPEVRDLPEPLQQRWSTEEAPQ